MDNIVITHKAGPRVEIKGTSKKIYKVEFIDDETGRVVFVDTIGVNRYTKANPEYYVKWRIKISEIESVNSNINVKTIHDDVLNLEGKNVLISFESSALGDTISWMPYVLEFKRKHNCNIYCATFKNQLFIDEYPEINFISRREVVPDVIAVYKIGWFGRGERNHKNKTDCRTIPLQKLICEALGLEYKEIRPKITLSNRPPLFNNDNYVAISVDSTAQAKYWNRPGGWQALVNWLNDRGYTVVVLGRQKNKLNNVIDKTGILSLEQLTNYLQYAKFYIGLSSGLAWMSWALGKKVVMIAGFTAKWFEFQENNYRVHNDKVCNSCFTDTRYWFNRGDWMWCPVHKNTPNHFICHKSITPEMVEEKVIELERDLVNNK